MNVIQKFYDLWNINSLIYSERIKVVNLKFNHSENHLPSIEKIQNILSVFPGRDEVILTVTNISDNSLIFSNKKEIIEGHDSNEFYEDIQDGDVFEIDLNIKKNIDKNVISVYNFNCFAQDIAHKSLIEVMRGFHYLLMDKEYLIFQLFDEELTFSTETLIFTHDIIERPVINFSRRRKIAICNEISSFFNIHEYTLIPEDFSINSDISDDILGTVFLKLQTILSMAYIADTSNINYEILNIEIYGQKKYVVGYNIYTDITINHELYKIYKWISTDGNALDKAIIARNIISLYSQVTDLINIDNKIFSSIQSNFRLYQKENVDKYLDLKNKLSEYLLELANNTADIVIELVDQLKKNMMGCFTFIFSVVLVNIVSSQPLDNIFTRDITILFELILLGSIVFMIISRFEMNYRLKKLKKGYLELKNSYSDILEAKDLEDIFQDDKIFNNHMIDANHKKILFLSLWLILLLVCLIIIEFVSQEPMIKSIIGWLLSLAIEN